MGYKDKKSSGLRVTCFRCGAMLETWAVRMVRGENRVVCEKWCSK